jgi:hypothetical protein
LNFRAETFSLANKLVFLRQAEPNILYLAADKKYTFSKYLKLGPTAKKRSKNIFTKSSLERKLIGVKSNGIMFEKRLVEIT